MGLLGHLSLWLALLVGLWGAITGFVGGAQQRPDLQQSARNATVALFGALLVAVISLEVAIFRHDFSLQYVASRTSRDHLAGRHVFRERDALRPSQSVPAGGVHAAGRLGDEPTAAEPRDGLPSPDAVPRLYLDHDPVCVRHGRAAHEKARCR